MSGKMKHACGVPESECLGTYTATNLRNAKLHATQLEAFKCHAKHLLSQGFVQVGPREFASPKDGPIRVLTKKCRFGAPYRQGKNNDKAGNRYINKRSGKGVKGGTVVSS